MNPELFNILTGDTLLAGGHSLLEIWFYDARQGRAYVLGTNWMGQVNGRNGITWEEKLALDLEYIENGFSY